MRTLELIETIARIPSFSSFEERAHPAVEAIARRHPAARVEKVFENNLLIEAPGRDGAPLVALTAHLDKINHFGADPPARLAFERDETRVRGLLDDAAGVGLALSLLLQSRTEEFPPLLILLSEMEEATDWRERPQLLKHGGDGYRSGLGAERLSRHLIRGGRLPALAITLDVTPKFHGAPGVALYCEHWELNGLAPSPELLAATDAVRERLLRIDPGILVSNNTNDYLVYGKVLNEESGRAIPSIALEPAVCPYHQADESIFIADLERVETALRRLLREDCA